MMRRPRFRYVVILLILAALSGEAVEVYGTAPGKELPMGPLGGRNLYAPHLPWYSFPADRATALAEGTMVFRTGIYYINEFSTYPFNPDDETLDSTGKLSDTKQNEYTALDYESVVWEVGSEWQVSKRWRVNVDWRLHTRYGGFLDGFIQGLHDVLGVPNAGREYFDADRSYWNVQGSNISGFSGSDVVVASGDLDLKALYTILQNPEFSMATAVALKLPTGSISSGFSTGYPDFGLSFLFDWRPWNRWIFYGNLGTIVPLGPEGRMMVQIIPAMEFRASRGLSILLQMNLQSSPILGLESDAFTHPIFGPSYMFSLMQMDLKIGLKGRKGNFGWQFYFEEDPFTWEGPDILVFIGADWSFNP